AEFPRMILPQEEVHIVELNRIDAIALDKMSQDGDGSFRRLHLLLITVGCVNTTEATVKRTADARMMNSGAFSKKGWTQVFIDWETMKRRPWEFIRPLHRSFPIAEAQAKHVLRQKTLHRGE